MAYKYSNSTYFVNTKDMTSYTCYSQGTSYGFRHIAFRGIVTNPTRRSLIVEEATTIERGNAGNMKAYYRVQQIQTK